MPYSPFDDDTARFYVVVDDQARHALWPAALDVPAGWRVVFGAGQGAPRQECLNYVCEHWTDMRPADLREALR